MGSGSYTSTDWAKLKESKKVSDSSSAEQIFVRNSMNEKFDPKFITFREARDSEEHPDSTPVIIGLDVTGSMGYLSAEIAKNGLNETMMKILSTQPISSPQIMFAALGDVQDDAPLQVTQFESDIRIAEQLMDLWLEGYGGDAPEDYQLLWYFAAKHTKTDCFEKRGKKGFLFTIGDADIHPSTDAEDIRAIFNDGEKKLSSGEMADMALEKYEVFHIHLGSYGDDGKGITVLNKMIPGRIAVLEAANVAFIPHVIISIMMKVQGKSMDAILDCWGKEAQPVVQKALSTILINDQTKGISF